MSDKTTLLEPSIQTEFVDPRGPLAAAAAVEPPTAAGGEGEGPTPRRQRALAHAILRVARKAIVDPASLEIGLAEDGPGVPVMAARQARARVTVRRPGDFGRLLLPPTPDSFAEGFLRGDLAIDGDLMAAVDAGQSLDLRRLDRHDLRRLFRWALELRSGTPSAKRSERISRMVGTRHSRARDIDAIRFHYDVGNAFYSLWLDQRMTYSCAYFPEGATPATAPGLLDEAQEAKLDLIARKLRLEPCMRLLDIGAGWGSLINFAVERYGTLAVGVTLSERQATESNERALAAGLADRARAEVLDYRDLGGPGKFDAVASVGMFEHVGQANMPSYFRAAYDALKPGGLFLNHGIASSRPSGARLGPDLRPRGRRFLERYVFPDGELVSIEHAMAVARAAGFSVIDVQSLRPHYALTLAAWVARLESNWAASVAAAGDEVARTWRLYMSAARLGFERTDLDVCQLLLAKPIDGGPPRLPLRPWW